MNITEIEHNMLLSDIIDIRANDGRKIPWNIYFRKFTKFLKDCFKITENHILEDSIECFMFENINNKIIAIQNFKDSAKIEFDDFELFINNNLRDSADKCQIDITNRLLIFSEMAAIKL